MNWANLKTMHCPKCDSPEFGEGRYGYECDQCDFRISYEKFQKVVSGMYSSGRHYDPDSVDRSDWS